MSEATVEFVDFINVVVDSFPPCHSHLELFLRLVRLVLTGDVVDKVAKLQI